MPVRRSVLPAALVACLLGFVLTVALSPAGARDRQAAATTSTVTVTPTPIVLPIAVGTSTSNYTVQPDPVTVTVNPETVTVTASPSPSPSTGTPSAALLWSADYNDGTLNAFQATSWNDAPLAPAVVTAPTFEGSYAGAYTVPSGGSRCENVPNLPDFTEGQDFWFGWSTYLAPSFPVSANTWQVITQWKNEGIGSPPLELKVQAGQFLLDGGYGWPGNTTNPKPRYASVTVGPASTGSWDRWAAHILFSSTASVATVDLWRNGVQVVTGYHPPGGTLYPNLTSYLKLGYYRDSAIKTDGTVYHDDWKVGAGQTAVAP